MPGFSIHAVSQPSNQTVAQIKAVKQITTNIRGTASTALSRGGDQPSKAEVLTELFHFSQRTKFNI